MTIVTTAIPRITDQFHSLDQVGWYGSVFFLTLACFQSVWGKLYTFLPVKSVFWFVRLFLNLGVYYAVGRSHAQAQKQMTDVNRRFSKQSNVDRWKSHSGLGGGGGPQWMLYNHLAGSRP